MLAPSQQRLKQRRLEDSRLAFTARGLTHLTMRLFLVCRETG